MNPHPLTTFIGTLALILVSVISGLIQQARSSDPLPWQTEWSETVEAKAFKAEVQMVGIDDVQSAVETGNRLILDARTTEDYWAGRIPTALSLPEPEFETAFQELADFLQPETPLLVYCGGIDCDSALQTILRLREAGCTNAVLFAHGWAAWSGEGRDVEQ